MPEKLKYSPHLDSSHGVIKCPIITPQNAWLPPRKPFYLQNYSTGDAIFLECGDDPCTQYEYVGRSTERLTVNKEGIEMQKIYIRGPETHNPRSIITLDYYPHAELVKHKGMFRNMWKKFVEGFRTVVFCGYVH
jgi:hypothetical protein